MWCYVHILTRLEADLEMQCQLMPPWLLWSKFNNSPNNSKWIFIRDQFGIDSMVDLATFHSLDNVFTNVRQVRKWTQKQDVHDLDERSLLRTFWSFVTRYRCWRKGCVTSRNGDGLPLIDTLTILTSPRWELGRWRWRQWWWPPFYQHINCISSLLMIWQICQIWYTNTKDRQAILFQALLMWPTGIASEESIHGAAQLLMKSIRKIRAAFTFRKKFRWNSNRF